MFPSSGEDTEYPSMVGPLERAPMIEVSINKPSGSQRISPGVSYMWYNQLAF
jgi:hypothetical protein